MDDERRKIVQKSIQSPFLKDFPEDILKIRRNLLATATLVLFYKCGELSIKADNSFLGVKVQGLTSSNVDIGLFLILLYFLVHFSVNGFSYIAEFRLRATGAQMILSDLLPGIGHMDHSLDKNHVAVDDVRQSTLFVWFEQHSQALKAVTNTLRHLSKHNEAAQKIDMAELKTKIENFERSEQAFDFMRVSLEQFGTSFANFLRLQNWRWLVLELVFPLVLGSFGLIYLMYDIYFTFVS